MRDLAFWLLILPGVVVFGLLSVIGILLRLIFRYKEDMATYVEMKRWEPFVIAAEAENRRREKLGRMNEHS